MCTVNGFHGSLFSTRLYEAGPDITLPPRGEHMAAHGPRSRRRSLRLVDLQLLASKHPAVPRSADCGSQLGSGGYVQDLAGDVACAIGEEEADRVRDIGGLDDPTER